MSDNQIVSAPTLGDLFRRAAEVLRELGHAKNDPVNPDGTGACLIHATGLAAMEMRLDFALRREADEVRTAQFLSMDIAEQFGCEVAWNDAPETTQTEVEKFLLACADRADFGGTA